MRADTDRNSNVAMYPHKAHDCTGDRQSTRHGARQIEVYNPPQDTIAAPSAGTPGKEVITKTVAQQTRPVIVQGIVPVSYDRDVGRQRRG